MFARWLAISRVRSAIPMIGLMPCARAFSWNSHAAWRLPWSVIARAGCSNSTARAIRSSIRLAPSSREYSEWQCRCTKDIELKASRCRAALSKRNYASVPFAKRLQRKELMRRIEVTSFALLFLAAGHRDGVDSAVPSCPAGAALLAPYDAVTVSSAQLDSCLTLPGNGATYLEVGQFASVGDPTNVVNWQINTSVASGSAAAASRPLHLTGDNPIRREFETMLRGIERTIAPRARAEAIAARRSPVRLSAAIAPPPALGTRRDFKVVAALDGSSFTSATARLVYAGDHVLLYVDTIGQGFSDAQYQSLGALFDRDLYAIDIRAFGSESDVDQNGRVIALFTPKINALVSTSNCAFAGYVTGFFYGTDLLVSDPNSNKGEIFFSYVPDSAGTYSCPHTAASVLQVVPGTFLHELQHMISFNQHVLVRGGAQEDVWLNEGLGQIAEELGSEYYEAKYPPPSGRSTTTQLFPARSAEQPGSSCAGLLRKRGKTSSDASCRHRTPVSRTSRRRPGNRSARR